MQRGGWTKEMIENWRPCITREFIRAKFNEVYKVGDHINIAEKEVNGTFGKHVVTYNDVPWKITKIFPDFAVIEHRGVHRALNLVSWWIEREKASI